jgi:hypothetical protein
VIRYQLATMARSRAVLAPVAAYLFVLLGVYAYRPNEVDATYAFTAVMMTPVAAWLAASAAFAEPWTQRQIATAAAGGVGPALRGRVSALALVVGVMAAVDVAFPAVFGLFDRHVSIEDLVTAALGHGGCGALGVALGLVAVPPTVRRPPTAFLVIAVYALLAVPLYDLAPVLSPAAWLAAAITDTDPRTVAGPVVLAAVVAVVHAAVVLAAGEALRRRQA